MDKNNSDKTEKIIIDANEIRKGAGEKLDTDRKKESGIVSLNEGAGLGISRERFTKNKKNN